MGENFQQVPSEKIFLIFSEKGLTRSGKGSKITPCRSGRTLAGRANNLNAACSLKTE
jgi:hypothetical protein